MNAEHHRCGQIPECADLLGGLDLRNNLQCAIVAGCIAAAAAGTAAAAADIYTISECSGQTGVGIATYSRTENRVVSSSTQLTEICWNQDSATMTAIESSRDLEKTSEAPGIVQYQRLAGGTVSPVNEQLQIGDGEPHPDSSAVYLWWTTESSRTPEELGGNDYVTIEGFVAADDAFAAYGGDGLYDVQMQLTGQDGPPPAMVFNMFLPMDGAIQVDGDALTLTLTGFFPGMGPGDVTLDAQLTRAESAFKGNGTLTMTNELLAGAPDEMWKTIDLGLDHFSARFAGKDGEEVVFVAGFAGDAASFGGETFPVTFTLVGQGQRAE